MLIKILIAVAAVIAVLAIVVALRPGAFRVVRSARIFARPAQVFAQVNDLRKWEAWSPWAKIDPACVVTYDGAPEGVGAVMSWNGNSRVGSGRMTITESRPDERVHIKLEFMRPWKATNAVEFTFVPQGEQTDVTWSMSGEANFMCKAFGLFMSMDGMVGKDFDKGLAQMKAVVEGQATPARRSTLQAVPA